MPYSTDLNKMVQDNKMKILKWLGNSPGMNPIESLWDIFKHDIHSEPTNMPLTTKK